MQCLGLFVQYLLCYTEVTMSRFARRTQVASAGIRGSNGDELPFGALYGRVITSNTHTTGDLPAQTTSGTSRISYTIQQNATNLYLTYTNWYNNNFKGSPVCHDEKNNAPITVQALVFSPGSNVGTPVTVAGQTSWTIAGGEWVQTDPLPIAVTTGQIIDVQTYAAGTRWYPTNIRNGGFQSGNHASAGSAKIATANVNGTFYAPAVITGDRSGPAVLIIGDSIGYGTGAQGPCYIDQGLVGHYGTINTAAAGDRLYWYLSGTYRSYSLFADSDCTTVVCEYCRNDLEDSRTVSQMQANLLTVWGQYHDQGKRVIQTTITPYTSVPSGQIWSADNQTIVDTTKESRRIELNTWIRAGSPMKNGAAVAPGTSGAVTAGQVGHPLYGHWEIADQVETAHNSGLWKYHSTDDGLHPNPIGINYAKLGVDYTMVA